MGYYSFDEEKPYGSFETFEVDGAWYWWPCFPGCLPDGEETGPFTTEQEAIDDAQENA